MIRLEELDDSMQAQLEIISNRINREILKYEGVNFIMHVLLLFSKND